MRVLDWLRPPRHLLLLFAAVTLVPAGALVWLGAQYFERDKVFGDNQIRQRLEASAERITSAIARELELTPRDLPEWVTHPPDSLGADATLVRVGPTGVLFRAGAPLLFAPVSSGDPAIDGPVAKTEQTRWAAAEALEYREKNFEKAAEGFRAIAVSADPATRAIALVATARNLRALGRREEALETYRRLDHLTTAAVSGEPADLVGRFGVCKLLEELGRRDELARSARLLADDLSHGRWNIDRATFEVRAAELRGWTPVVIDDDALARAAALERFWTEHLAGRDGPVESHQSFSSNNRGILVIWRVVGQDVVALAVSAPFVARVWLEPLASSTAHISFAPGNSPYTVKKRAADLGLPWDLFVSDTAAAADAANAAVRRRLLGWSLAALVILIPAGGYVVWRAVQKELAVARLQTDFVSAVSHEFRTPLTSMAHLTERLQRDGSIPENRKRQYYDVLARDTDRLRRFVETLLDFGRMEAGADPVRTKDDDLAAVVAEVVSEFRGEATAAEREIRVETNGTLPSVKLDRDAFGRALWNLLDNASKYSPAGSPITVAIRRESQTACVDVSDLGPGIPASERRQIFHKFVRGEDSKAAGIKGTGVGLALVDRIIRAHGGEVHLESVVGHGSTFSLVLPIPRVES